METERIVELAEAQQGGDAETRAAMTWVHVCVFGRREAVERG